jgi:hypothetical protein
MANGSNGSVHIRIPRSFQGPITATAHSGSVIFSEQITANLTTFDGVDSTRRSFVGDLSQWTDNWQGDEVVAETRNGGVKVQYDDEVIESYNINQPYFGFAECNGAMFVECGGDMYINTVNV